MEYSDYVFYHIYPLGMCKCAKRNDFCCAKGDSLRLLTNELDRIKTLGVNAIYIGPLFESTSHGYDTVDYYYVDRRLGNNEDFIYFVESCHSKGIRVIVDAVFNHTGRDFFAFKDLLQWGHSSRYRDWYKNVNFEGKSSYGDNLDYEGWAGCKDLVKLNVDNPEVQAHLFGAVEKWIDEFHIDGLRLDAADVLSSEFLCRLNSFVKSKKPDFWLMGEVVHGDYNYWVNEQKLDSVTNYQLYKGMWSSFNEGNMFEVAYNLKEEFGNGQNGTPNGKYKGKILYNFLDNHDVNRLASTVKDQSYLFALYGLLFTVPGIPSIYYHSEKGVRGIRKNCGAESDYELRPAVPPFIEDYSGEIKPYVNPGDLEAVIQRFSRVRSGSNALRKGDYEQVFVSNTALAFKRSFYGEEVIVVINQEKKEVQLSLPVQNGTWRDTLNGGTFSGSDFSRMKVSPCWLRILQKV